MATYRITAPNGVTYQIDGPDGASREDVIAAIERRNPEAGKPASQSPSKGGLGEFLVGQAEGLASGIKGIGPMFTTALEKQFNAAKAHGYASAATGQLDKQFDDVDAYANDRMGGSLSNSPSVSGGLREMLANADKGQLKKEELASIAKAKAAQERDAASRPHFANPATEYLYNKGLPSLVQSAIPMGISAATRSATPMMMSAALQSYLDSYGDARIAGAEHGNAQKTAAVSAMAEVGGELLPTGVLVDKFGRAATTKFLAEFVFKDFLGEQATTAVQDAAQYAFSRPDLSPREAIIEYINTRPQAFMDTTAGVLVTAGGVGAVNHGIRRLANLGKDKAAAAQAAPGAPPAPPSAPPAEPNQSDIERAHYERLVASGATEEDAAKAAKRMAAQAAVNSGIVRDEVPAAPAPAPAPSQTPASGTASSISPTMGAMRIGPTTPASANEASASLPPIAPPSNPTAPMKERIAQVTQSVQETAQAAGVEITPKQTNVIAQQVARGKDPEKVLAEVAPEAAAAIKETTKKRQEKVQLDQVQAATAALDPTNPAVQQAPAPAVAAPPIAAITPTPAPRAPVETPKVEAPTLTQRRVGNGVFMVSKGRFNFVVEKNADGTWGVRLPEQEKQVYTFKDKKRAVASAEAMADSFAEEDGKQDVSQEVEAQPEAVPEDAAPEVQQAAPEAPQADTPAPPEAPPEAVADKPVAVEAGPAEQRAPDDFERLKAETEAEHPYEVVYRPDLKKPYELYENKEDGTRVRVARSTNFDNFKETVGAYTRPKTDADGNPITYVPEGVAGGVKRGGARESQRDTLTREDVLDEVEPELTPSQIEQSRIYQAVTLAHQQGQITDQQYATLRDMLRPEEVQVQGSDEPVIRRTDPDKVLQQLTSFKLENKGAPQAAAPKANTRGADFTETRERAAAFKAEQAARTEQAKQTVGRILLERQISEEDKADLAKEYGEPEFNESALSRFANDFVDYINGVKRSFSKVVERVIKSVQAGVMSAMVVFSPAQLQPIQNFQLLPENQQESTITYEVRDPVPENAKQQMSPLAQEVYARVAHTAMSKGKGFFIADKPNGMIHAFDAKGEYLSSSAALYGKQAGDTISDESFNRRLDDMTDADRITPAGTFGMKHYSEEGYTGGSTFHLQNLKTGKSLKGIAVHAVYTGTPSEKRLQRLETKTAADNKVSFGCINTGNKFFLDEVLPHAKDFDGGFVFVLPDETASTDALFPQETRTVEQRARDEGASTETPAQTQDERALPREQRQQLQAQRRTGRRRSGRSVFADDWATAEDGTLIPKEPTAEDWPQRVKDAQEALNKALYDLGFPEVAGKIVSKAQLYEITKNPKANGLQISDPVQPIIYVALDGFNPLKTTYHELGHAIRSLDLFTPAEWRIMVNEAKRQGLYAEALQGYKNAKDEDLTPEQLVKLAEEESAVEAMGRWFSGQASVEPTRPAQKVYERLQEFFRAVKNALNGLGFRSAEDIYRDVYNRKISARERGVERQGERDYKGGMFDQFADPKKAKKTKAKINKAVRQAQQSVAAMGNKEAIAAAQELDSAFHSASEAHIPDGASLADWLKNTDLATVRTTTQFYPTSSIVDLVHRTVPEVGQKADEMVKIMQKKVGEAQSMLAGSERIARELNKTITKSSTAHADLAMAISLARRGRVDVENLPPTLDEALAQDPVLKEYDRQLQDPALKTTQKANLTRGRNTREGHVKAAFKAWEQLGRNEGGHAAFKRLRQYYQDMYELTRMHLDARVEGLDIDDASKRKLMAQIRAEQEEAKGGKDSEHATIPSSLLPDVYFPFQRHGEYWLRVGKSETGRELHFFDDIHEREKYIRTRKAKAERENLPFENIDTGTGLDELRSDFVENTAMLKKMFETIDKAKGSTKTDLDKLKNQLYQTWLLTSPERSVRRQFLHADLVTGESADVLRNFRTTAVQYANQLSALKYDDQLFRTAEEAKALREGYEGDHRTMEKAQVLMDLIKDRFTTDYTDPSKFADFINRMSFLYYLTSAATAIAQPAAIPIRVATHLGTRYGYGKTTAALMRYMPFWKTVGMTETLLDGSKVWVAPNMERSAMIRNNPLRRKAMAEGRRRAAFQTTTASLLHATPTPQGVAKTALHSASRVFWETTTGLFNASELLSRQMTYMAAFDLAYAKTKNFEAAVDEAVRVTNDTMGDYNTYDTPKVARNAIGRVLFLFKRYAANTTRFFLNNARQIWSGPDRAQALHELSGVLLMGWMFHGVVGQPLYGFICSVIDLLFKAWDDDEAKKRRAQNPLFADDADSRFRYQWLPKFLGAYEMPGLDGRMHSLNKVMELGPISELTDVNIGSRTSFSDMWFRDGAPADSPDQALVNTVVANIPGVSMGVSIARGIKDWQDGRPLKGLEKVSPAFVRGALAATRLNSEGVETSHGEKIVRRGELNDLNLAAQILGFQPTQVADLSKQHYAIQQQKMKLTSDRTKLMRRLNDALFNEERNDGDIEKAAEKIRKWNETYGSVPFLVITNDQVASSIKNFATNRAMSYRGTTFSKKEAPTVLGALLGEDPWATAEQE